MGRADGLAVTALGVKDLVLVNAARVDKSYFQSPVLSEAALTKELVLGLEQAVDTVLPRVTFERRFRPFVEDRLPSLIGGRRAYVGDPASPTPLGDVSPHPALVAIGPEGGFVPFELDRLFYAGLRPVHLGARILTSDVATVAVAAHWATRPAS